MMTITQPARVLPDDVLSAILALAEQQSGEDRFAFRGHDFRLQQIFSELSKEFPVVSKYFVFSSTGPVPYSPILNESISRLQLSGLIGRENPDYEVLFLRPTAQKYFTQALKARLDPETIDQLSKVAEALVKRFKAS